MPKLTRRDFLLVNAASIGALSTDLDVSEALASSVLSRFPSQDPSLVEVDYEALVSRSDLHYLSPVDDPSDGQPIANGRMGTAVWTTPSSIGFQINRVDVFAVNRNHRGVFLQSEDRCGACCAITVDMGGNPFAKGDQFHQRLSLYNAESQIHGQDVTVRCFVSAVTDVLVVEIDDQRPQPGPFILKLSAVGQLVEQVGEWVASVEYVKSGNKYGLTRKYTEEDFYCRSMVAVNVVNGTLKHNNTLGNEQTLRLERVQPGKMILHIASAASMDPKVDVVAQAFKRLSATAGKSYVELQQPHQAWWHQFWHRTFIALHSADGNAVFMQQMRNLYLYIMASCARGGGSLAPKWNDMLFSTQGDGRGFGSQFWGWTMEPLYMPLFAAGASDIADVYFNMYTAQLPQCRIAAQQRFNAKGAYFPEISTYDGPQTLPNDVAKEYRDILLDHPNRKPLSDRARKYGMFDVPIYDLATDGWVVAGHYTQTSHLFTTGPRIAQHAWLRYRHTGDKEFLRTRAYPLLRDCVEFYRSIVVREADGLYHIEQSGLNDGFQGVKDGISDLAAIRGITPLAIRAANILGVDADLRTRWKDLLTHLAPFTMGSDPESQGIPGVLANDVWSAAHKADGGGVVGSTEDVQIYPIVPFEVYTLETKDPEMTRIANKVVSLMPVYQMLISGQANLGTTARTPIAVIRVGHGEDLPMMLCTYHAAFPQTANGMSPFEGGARSIEHLGINTITLHEGLLQSVAEFPGDPEVIRVFPAWPKGWNATFALEARGGFLVTASMNNGIISFVEIESRRGEPCQIRNPWKSPCFLAEVGKKKQVQSDDLIRFSTKAGQKYRLFQGEPPAPLRIGAPTVTTPTSYAFTLANGATVGGTLGRGR